MPPRRPRLAASAATALLCCTLACGTALAQGQGLRLQRSLGDAPGGRSADLPTFVTADRIEGLGEFEVEASGNAELRRGDMSLLADRIRYVQDLDEVEATGDVRLRVGADEISGPRLRLRLNDTTGIFEHPRYRFAPRLVRHPLSGGAEAGTTTTGTEIGPQLVLEARGEAEAIRFDGEQRYRANAATFTTCKPGQDDWHLEAERLDLDMGREVGTAREARLTFLGASTPRLPWFDFSLSNERKTGFLPPSFGVQNNTGLDFLLPFYWNIAPNYDATITPRYMEQRGIQFLNEFRFMESWFRGEARYEILPEDKELKMRRYGTALAGTFGLDSWTGLVNVQRVSDDNYFRDLSGRLSIATQTYLPQEGAVYYSSPAGWWNAGARIQRFQTLQDQQNPVPLPYFREPQFTINAVRQTLGGLDVGFRGDYTSFKISEAGMPDGQRTLAYPSVTLPLTAPYGYVKAKLGFDFAQYYLTTTGTQFVNSSPSRAIPVATLDTGLFFDRGVSWFGRDFVQTIEPRLFYAYAPFEDQSDIPVFDTSNTDFTFSQLFQENIFVGGDRRVNANQLSLAATSRLLGTRDGQEVLRAVIGQRYYFVEQLVTIPGQPVRTDSVSPLVLGLSGRVTPSVTANVDLLQRLTSGGSPEKVNVGVRYSPAPGSVASAAYRYTAENLTAGVGPINSVDVAAQWPLGRGFYGLGRFNYDLDGNKTVDALFGLEYNAGCWVFRAVAHQFQTSTAQETTLFYIQLELNGIARIGSNPLDTLRRSIPGYALVNQAVPAGSGPPGEY